MVTIVGFDGSLEPDPDYPISETGPWSVRTFADEAGKQKVVLQSEDFTHDVWLEVTGDFADLKQRVLYAAKLADRMNRMPKE